MSEKPETCQVHLGWPDHPEFRCTQKVYGQLGMSDTVKKSGVYWVCYDHWAVECDAGYFSWLEAAAKYRGVPL